MTWQATPVFLPGESRGQRSLVGYSPQGGQEQDRDPHTHSPGSPASSDQETPPREHSTLSRNSLSSETSTSFTYLLQILIHYYEMLLVLYYLVTNKHQLPTMR